MSPEAEAHPTRLAVVSSRAQCQEVRGTPGQAGEPWLPDAVALEEHLSLLNSNGWPSMGRPLSEAKTSRQHGPRPRPAELTATAGEVGLFQSFFQAEARKKVKEILAEKQIQIIQERSRPDQTFGKGTCERERMQEGQISAELIRQRWGVRGPKFWRRCLAACSQCQGADRCSLRQRCRESPASASFKADSTCTCTRNLPGHLHEELCVSSR